MPDYVGWLVQPKGHGAMPGTKKMPDLELILKVVMPSDPTFHFRNYRVSGKPWDFVKKNSDVIPNIVIHILRHRRVRSHLYPLSYLFHNLL